MVAEALVCFVLTEEFHLCVCGFSFSVFRMNDDSALCTYSVMGASWIFLKSDRRKNALVRRDTGVGFPRQQ